MHEDGDLEDLAEDEGGESKEPSPLKEHRAGSAEVKKVSRPSSRLRRNDKQRRVHLSGQGGRLERR